MQGIQPAERYLKSGNVYTSFIRAVVNNRDEHEIFLALNSRYPDTIGAFRAAFADILPPDAIRVWHEPHSPAAPEGAWRSKAASIIRHTFLAGLDPDIVHLAELPESCIHEDCTDVSAGIPYSVSLFDSAHNVDELRSAALLFTGDTLYETVAASFPENEAERLVRLTLTGAGDPRQEVSGKSEYWNRAAQEALRAWKAWHTRHNGPHREIGEPRRLKLAYVSPLPPERSGISDYSAELLPELLHYYDIDLIVDQERVIVPGLTSRCAVRNPAWLKAHAGMYDRIVYHFGNSPFHKHMFGLLEEVPGIVVLHDFFLSGIVAHLDIKGITPGGWAKELYHAHGYTALRQYLQEDDKEPVVRNYPCNYSVLGGAEGVIVHSEYACRLADEWYGRHASSHWRVVPHLRVPADRISRSEARRKLGIDENSFLVCSFGLLGAHKMNHRLLDAWLSSSLAADTKCHLVFVGENEGGRYGKQLLEKIGKHTHGKRVRITGWASMELFRTYLAAADAGVQLRMNSRGESSGTVLDCMNYALPTIVNAHGSMAELPKDCVIMLPDAFSDKSLSDSLELLRNDDHLRREVGRLAQKRVESHHNPGKVTRMYVEAIETCSRGPEKYRSSAIEAIARIEGLPGDEKRLLDIATAITASMPSRARRKQLLIDVSALVKEDLKTGIQRVVRSIVKNLVENPPDGFRVEPVYAAPEEPYRYARRFTAEALGCPPSELVHDAPLDIQHGDILFIPDLHFQVVKSHRKFLGHIRNCGARVVFLVHDILPVRHPAFFPEGTYDEFHQWLTTVTESDAAICVTKTVADDLHTWLTEHNHHGERPFMIGWNHHGADIDASIPSKGFPQGFQHTIHAITKRPTILMVGTVEPRKGHALALMAMELLWEQHEQVNLVIVGKQGWMIDSLSDRIRKHQELERRLFWFQGISDEALLKLYNTASGVLMASEGEGFGLPLIEAAQHGCPVLARDIPVFREIGGKHISYFPGNSPEELARSMKVWLDALKKKKAPDSALMSWLTWDVSCRNLAGMLVDNKHEQWVYQWL